MTILKVGVPSDQFATNGPGTPPPPLRPLPPIQKQPRSPRKVKKERVHG